MRRILLFVFLAISSVACGCLPNPQSEWVTSEGGEQRSTLDDESISPPSACDCAGYVDNDDGARPSHVYVAHPHVVHASSHIAHVHVARAGRR